ncbi:hypothetical protein [Parahaliea mediterranea]|uniref:Uncharacterized protein n=1 Tax=Parahaliea mediterranea TaxID=651086 RepID=A0A939ILE0_9GAMM|nr:hypothetical protein [Parahaliea mediterranea]MBN7795873.1 hypothetical protein [Parahaliea mediterranea]
MSEYEFWSLIVGAVAAIGTLAAVCVSLWVVLRKPKKFAVGDVQVFVDVTLLEDGQSEANQGTLRVEIKNMIDAKMHVFCIDLVYDVPVDNGAYLETLRFPCERVFIPAHSKYIVPADLTGTRVAPETLDKAENLRVEVSTSFGDESIPFPSMYFGALRKALEKGEISQDSARTSMTIKSPKNLKGKAA